MSQALIDFGVSHEDVKKFIDEKEKYEKIKENIKNTKNIGEVDPPLQGDATLIYLFISPYQRNTMQTLLFKLFEKLIRLELVEDS